MTLKYDAENVVSSSEYYHCWDSFSKEGAILDEKSLIFYQKSPTFNQKGLSWFT